LLHSGSLPAGASLGQIWFTIPDLATTARVGNRANYLPTLRVDHVKINGTLSDGSLKVSSGIKGMPLRFDAPYTEAQFVDFCRSYPTLAGSTGRPVTGEGSILDDERQSVQVFRA
jgi:hypothetical protein